MTTVRKGAVQTRFASRYLQQLCKHWSHKFDVAFDDSEGTIELALGLAEMTANVDALRVALRPKSKAELDRFQQVVEDHLNRFAFREAPLAFVWRDEED